MSVTLERGTLMSKDTIAQIVGEMHVRKIKQADMANMLGISSPYLGEILNGKKTYPKAQHYIDRMCEILNI